MLNSIPVVLFISDKPGHLFRRKQAEIHTQILRPSKYRGNFVESRELTGAIMQCEKYLFDLTSDKKKFEDKISKKFYSFQDKW